MLLVLLAACSEPEPGPVQGELKQLPRVREAATWPFAVDSPWNHPLGARADLTDDDCTADLRDERVDAWINAEEWSHPIIRAAADDPWVEVWEEGKWVTTLQVPASARAAEPDGGDNHLHVVDPAGHMVDELWHAVPRAKGGWAVDSWTRNDLYGPGFGTGGVRIFGGSAIGGLIRTGEAEGGIPHALALSLPPELIEDEYTWPATEMSTSREDDFVGHVPVGQLVALPADVDVEALAATEAGRSVARALRDYGAYLVDHAGSFALYAEPGAEAEVDRARDDLDAIRAALACVGNASEAEPGGPGERRAAWAPEIGERIP